MNNSYINIILGLVSRQMIKAFGRQLGQQTELSKQKLGHKKAAGSSGRAPYFNIDRMSHNISFTTLISINLMINYTWPTGEIWPQRRIFKQFSAMHTWIIYMYMTLFLGWQSAMVFYTATTNFHSKFSTTNYEVFQCFTHYLHF